jgi:hypothetical protein
LFKIIKVISAPALKKENRLILGKIKTGIFGRYAGFKLSYYVGFKGITNE